MIITMIGAASTTFGPKVLRDVLNHPQLGSYTLRLVDINAERLDVYARLAQRVNAAMGQPLTIESTTDRRVALPGSDYVIINIDTGHYNTWEQDFALPVRAGVRQVMGELGGPGGLFHALRQIPLHLDIARDVAALCPQAHLLVASNPLNRICLALHRHGQLADAQITGLCHGAEMALYLFLNRALDIDGDDLETTAAGTNHLTWMLDLRRKSTGEDLYPLLRERMRTLPTDEKMGNEQGLSRKLLEVYGYFPATLDSHAGEYLPYAHEFCGLAGIDFEAHREQEQKRWAYLRDLADDEAQWGQFEQLYGDQSALSAELRLDDFFAPRRWSDTLAFPLITAIEQHERTWMPALNTLNQGTIANLPADIFVETPAVVDGSGVHPLAVGDLPAPLAAFNRRDIDQLELTVEAAITGDRRVVMQAMLLDPVVDSVRAAEQSLDALLEAHAANLPQFA